MIFQGDVSKREDNEKMIDLAVSEFGKLDVLVNNAGIMDDMSGVGDATDEKFEQVMKVNVYGPMCAMRKAISVFKEQGNGAPSRSEEMQERSIGVGEEIGKPDTGL